MILALPYRTRNKLPPLSSWAAIIRSLTYEVHTYPPIPISWPDFLATSHRVQKIPPKRNMYDQPPLRHCREENVGHGVSSCWKGTVASRLWRWDSYFAQESVPGDGRRGRGRMKKSDRPDDLNRREALNIPPPFLWPWRYFTVSLRNQPALLENFRGFIVFLLKVAVSGLPLLYL